MPKIDTLWYDLEARTQDFETGIARSRTALSDFTAYVKANPIAVVGGLTASIVALGAASARTAAMFETEMAKVQTVLQGTKAQLDAMAVGVLGLFRELPLESVQDLSAALYDVISSGTAAGDALEVTRVAAEASIGGMTTTAIAVDGLTTALNAWRGENLTAREVADQMFEAVNKGKVSFGELASSLGQVAGIAPGVRVGLDEILAGTAQLTLLGNSGSEAITGLRGVITGIINPTGEWAAKFPELSREFNRAKLEAVGLVGFLTEFAAATEGNSAAVTALFSDIRALNAVMGLTTDGGKALNQMLLDVRNSQGAAATATATMSETTEGLNQRLKNDLHATFIEIGQGSLPLYNKGLQAALWLMQQINEEVNNLDSVKLARTFGDRNAGLGSLDPDKLRRYRSDVLGLLRDLNSGELDPSKLGTGELAALRDAAANTLAGGRTTGAEYLKADRLARSLSVDPKGLTEYQRAFRLLDSVAEDAARRDRSRAAEAEKASKARMEAAAREVTAEQSVAAAAARGAEEYRGAADRVVRAAEARATAMRTIGEEQARLSKAESDAAAALAAGDEGGVTAARERASAARQAIQAQALIVREAQDTLAQDQRQRAAKLASEQKAAAKAAASELAQSLKATSDELQRTQERAAETARRFAESQESALVETTATKVDDLELALQRYTEAAEEARRADPLGFDDGAHKRRLAAYRQQIEGVKALEAVQKQAADAEAVLADIARRRSAAAADGNTTFAPSKKDVASLETWRGTLRTIADDTRRTDAERELAARVLLQVESELAGVHQDQNAKKKLLSEQNEKIAQQTLMIARGAISAADAFGVMSDSSAKTAQEVANMAEGVTKLVASGGKDIGAWVQTIGSGLNLAADAFGLSDAMEEKKARKANRDAVDRLTEFADVLAVAITNLQQFTGAAIDGVARAAQYLADVTQQVQGGSKIVNVEETLRAFGTTVEEATAIAKANGINLDGTVDSYRRLNEAMQQTMARVTEFGTGLDDARANQELYFKAFKMERGPQDALVDMLVAGSGTAPDLGSQLLGAFSAGGIGALREELQAIVTVLGPGGASLDPKLLGGMSPAQFRAYISDLLDAVAAVEEELAPKVLTAAEKLSASLASLSLSWELDDVTDPSQRLAQVTEAMAAMDPALAALADGLDLATTGGLDEFGRRVADFARLVEAESVEIEGFTRDQLLDALQAWETGADAAAAAILAAAEAQRAYTVSLEKDLAVRKLRAQGLDGEADLLTLSNSHAAQLEEARKNNVTPELLAELLDVQKLEWVQALARQSEKEERAASSQAGGRASVVASAGAQSVDLLIGIGNTGLALDRERNAILASLARALTAGPMPQLQPPLAAAVFGGGRPIGGSSGGGGMVGAIAVHVHTNFYAPVYGAEQVETGIRRAGTSIGVEIQRAVDNQRRLEGRPEVY